jgi:hypothetical protein
MKFLEYLNESIVPRKPGNMKKRQVKKNKGLVGEYEVTEISFTTALGNVVKVQWNIKNLGTNEKTADIVFYVNDTLDDRGGRGDGSVDHDIMGGVLWIVDMYADKLGLKELTFSAWSGKGDTKLVSRLDMKKPLELTKKGVSEYMEKVRGFTPTELPVSKSRMELAMKLGREPVKLFDVDVGNVMELLGEIQEKLGNNDVMIAGVVREFGELVYGKLDEHIPGGRELYDILQKYVTVRLSHEEGGVPVHKNRRKELYTRLMDKFFKGKWDVKESGGGFTLTRKNNSHSSHVATETVGRKLRSICEMPAFNDSDGAGDISKRLDGVVKSPEVVSRYGEKVENFPYLQDYTCDVYRKKNHTLTILVWDRDSDVLVGKFIWGKNVVGNKPVWMTMTAAVQKTHQGKGIGAAMYNHAIWEYMGYLFSDETLTGGGNKSGSFQLWQKLGREFPYRYTLDVATGKLEQIYSFELDMMGDKNIRFGVSTTALRE